MVVWVVATQICCIFHPETLGFHDPIRCSHIFQMGWLKPPTSFWLA